ncbi:MAG: hypothetical protein IIC67_07200 [Thaumarchaeota archaeon]|nr:hypothetical protein [Nitrososphaerota archaeon]
MKTRNKILIPAVAFLAFVIFYLYIIDNGYSSYNEGIGLTRFSEDEFQKYVKEAGSLENLNIIKLTDEELKKIPIIKELIEKSLRKEFPLNRVGILNSTLDEIKSNHYFVAQKYAAKYNKNPDSYFSTRLPEENQLEKFPNSYWYEYDGRFFKYGERYYSFYDTDQLVNYVDPHRIEVGVLKHDLTQDRFYVELTDDDWQHIPKVKEAIDKIGTLQEDIRVQVGMSQSDLNKYQQWIENYRGMVVGSFLEYEGEHYRIAFWIT